jgi:hypothetical protein
VKVTCGSFRSPGHAPLTMTSPLAKRLLRARPLSACGLLLALLTSSLAFAAEATGVLTGRVSNAPTRLYLENAEIHVVGSALATVTDREGRFTLSGVPAGPRVLTVAHVGLDETKMP